METAALADPRVQQLLGEATALRILGLLFERPRDAWRQEVEGLSREVSDPEVRAAAEAGKEEASEGLYLALLGLGGAVSPREVTYRGMEDPGRILADINAFYEAFAFQPETEEAPDHVAVEAGFLGYLCLKEAYARARSNDDEAEIVANAAARFRETHLATFAWPVADGLAKADVRYLCLAASTLARRCGPRQDTRAGGKISRRMDDTCSVKCGEE